MIGQQMDDTENIHAWAGEDVSWAHPTGQWVSRWDPWRRRLNNVAMYSVPAIAVAAAAMWLTTGAHTDRQATPPVMNVTPTAPPVPHPEQSPVDPYYTQSVSREEFLDSLRRNNLPIPGDAVKEAGDICRLLDGGMPFRAAAMNTAANHPDWTMVNAGGFTGAATGFCPKYRP